MKTPTRIGALVAADPVLQRLLTRARALQQLDEVVKTWLPGKLAEKVTVAVVREGVLVLCAESPVWATRLRYEVPNLLEKAALHPELNHLKAVEVRVGGR